MLLSFFLLCDPFVVLHYFSPFDFPLYTLLIFMRGHKKIKYTLFFHFSVCCCQKLFCLLCCIREIVFMRCLRIGSTQTAPFHLMLSLTWNKVFFIAYVFALCAMCAMENPNLFLCWMWLFFCFFNAFNSFFSFIFFPSCYFFFATQFQRYRHSRGMKIFFFKTNIIYRKPADNQKYTLQLKWT